MDLTRKRAAVPPANPVRQPQAARPRRIDIVSRLLGARLSPTTFGTNLYEMG